MGADLLVAGLIVLSYLATFGGGVILGGATGLPPQCRSRLDDVVYWLEALAKQGVRLMTTAADLNAKIDRILASQKKVAADVRNLKLNGGALSAAEAEALDAKLEGIATSLEALDAETEDVADAPAQPDGGATEDASQN